MRGRRRFGRLRRRDFTRNGRCRHRRRSLDRRHRQGAHAGRVVVRDPRQHRRQDPGCRAADDQPASLRRLRATRTAFERRKDAVLR
ncbi:hypothetical protein D3872_17950 [Massilia cavernae]|uniref:Uncharacterized protein n=1 Tax=Massilia cavernae TaxID=2320864 RepID=A0A418XH41_9BURK|nr:hypothetical protein D3872_17950 [Massilia cavernae]